MQTNFTLNVFIRTTLMLSLVFIYCTHSFAQNLVKNPSFEAYESCPQEFGSFQEDVNSWYKPTSGSTDYFNACGSKLSTGFNFMGKQESFEGNAYAGFYAYGPDGYREYISGQFHERLKKGKKYKFSFNISLADKSKFAINEFGILFTEQLVNFKTKKNISLNMIQERGLNSYIELKKETYYSNKESWTKISGTYVAKGNESYFTIGNFRSNGATHKVKVANNPKKISYYFIDMVTLERDEPLFELNETYVFENLFFKVNGYKIIGEGKNELQQLVEHLKTNPDLNISVFGHTDNIGSKNYNKELSQKRAQMVGTFLIKNGLSADRISWKGFGDQSPVAANETDSGRKKNRRVEFVVTTKNQENYASNSFEEDN